MFHLFNEGGVKPQRLFSEEDFNNALKWASDQIIGIEEASIVDWLICKEKPDFYCTELCSARKNCPNGVAQTKRTRKTEEYEEYKNDPF